MAEREIKHFFACQVGNINTQYSAPETPPVPAFLSIRQNGKEIGTLNIATSNLQVYNNSPVGKYRGDPGFRIDLFYVKDKTSVKSSCTQTISATDHSEISKQITFTDEYSLNFSLGWNLVKVDIVSSENVGVIPYYKTKLYSAMNQIRDDAKWVFTKI